MRSVTFPLSAVDFTSLNKKVDSLLSPLFAKWLAEPQIDVVKSSLWKAGTALTLSDTTNCVVSNELGGVLLRYDSLSIANAMAIPAGTDNVSKTIIENLMSCFSCQCLSVLTGCEVTDVESFDPEKDFFEYKHDFSAPTSLLVFTAAGCMELIVSHELVRKLIGPIKKADTLGGLTSFAESIDMAHVKLSVSLGLIKIDAFSLSELKVGQVLESQAKVNSPLSVKLESTTLVDAFIGRRGDRKAIVVT